MQRLQSQGGPDYAGRSAEVRKELRRSVPWLRALLSSDPSEDRYERFMSRTDCYAGIPLRVIEMAGEPGDVIVMHPWVFHAPAPNCSEVPRMMLTERIRVGPSRLLRKPLRRADPIG